MNDRLRLLHDRWATGRVIPVIGELRASSNSAVDDASENLRLFAMEARFVAHSGFLPVASKMFRRIPKRTVDRTSTAARCSIYYCLGYYAYEVQRNFSKAYDLFEKSLTLARKVPLTSDTALVATAASWRQGSIAQAKGDTSTSRRLLANASAIADDWGDHHMKGVILLARGNRSLQMKRLSRAHDELLQGLFCVGYDSALLPHYLHAELLLALSRVQMARLRRFPRGPELLNCLQTLDRVRPALSKGKGWIVTPYEGHYTVSPAKLLSDLADSDRAITRTRQKLSAKVIDRVKRAFGGRCTWCGSGTTVAIDHILPFVWGGTDWEGNLRVLCRTCNSSRKHYFTCIDRQGYEQLILRIDDDMVKL